METTDKFTNDSTAPQFHGDLLDRFTYMVAEIIRKVFVVLSSDVERKVRCYCTSEFLGLSESVTARS
jgi:hypothetical protein